ncbi:MAG TPA: FAD-dependent oxidoreductase, partial [Candidatus Krumholzibacteria bacterium]|nr:FAD-dependent oxidoreductase [Candidatus Krumholzibacteria bacterium]
WDSLRAAMDQIAMNVRRERIECEFDWVPGYLHTPFADNPDEKVLDHLRSDAELANELGFQATFRDTVPVMGRPGVQFMNQAKFHPRKYVAGLLRAIAGNGCDVFEQTNVEDVEDEPLRVRANGHSIRCGYVVIATHVPIMGKAGTLSATLLQTKLYPYSTYAMGAKVAAGTMPEGVFWDTGTPYYYLRVDRHHDHDYLIYGGEDHKTGQEKNTVEVFRRLEAALHRIAPNAVTDHRWSGQVIETPDGLPYIGETTKGQFVSTGYSGQGMTFGTLGAMMAVDAYLARENPWSDLYAPDRKAIKTGKWDYLRENAQFPYYLVRDRLSGAEDDSLSALARNSGMILSLSGRKVAAFRDENGNVTLLSPVCTHLKCIVAWNEAEQTWDCPCHGSRFRATGEVFAGPAEENLERLSTAELSTREK